MPASSALALGAVPSLAGEVVVLTAVKTLLVGFEIGEITSVPVVAGSVPVPRSVRWISAEAAFTTPIA